MPITRRAFLAASGAAAVATAAPHAVAVAAEAVAPKPGTWGYSFDEESWYIGYATREDATAEALSYGLDEEATYYTGFCNPVPLHHNGKHAAEDVCNWLCGGITKETPGEMLSGWFEGCNQDADWEGELSDAIARADIARLETAATAAISTALSRAGWLGLAAAILAGKDFEEAPCDSPRDEALFAVLEADEQFHRDLEAALVAWIAENKIGEAPRILDICDQDFHTEEPAEAEA